MNTLPQRQRWYSWVWNARSNTGIQRKASLTVAFLVTVPPFSLRRKWIVSGHRWNLLCKGIGARAAQTFVHQKKWLSRSLANHVQAASQENKKSHQTRERMQVKAKNWQCCLQCCLHQGHANDNGMPQTQSNNCMLQLSLALSLLCQSKKAARITQCLHQPRMRETRWGRDS